MNDDAYRLRTEAVEHIIRQLERGDLSLDEGEELYRDGKNLIAAARDLLDTGNGDVDIID